MPRGIPKVENAGGEITIWDFYCAAALTGIMSRQNGGGSEAAASAAAVAADRLVARRMKHIKPDDNI